MPKPRVCKVVWMLEVRGCHFTRCRGWVAAADFLAMNPRPMGYYEQVIRTAKKARNIAYAMGEEFGRENIVLVKHFYKNGKWHTTKYMYPEGKMRRREESRDV